MLRHLCLLAVLLSGCAFVPESALEERLDMDGDGVPRPTDCDDTDPSVTTNTWYADSDGDGYGNTTELQGCDLEEGYVAQGGDCLDDVAEVYPGAPEVCNEVDDDCDGETDEGLEVPVWYLDGDDDGFGGDDESVTACVAPSSEYTEQDGDCDDEDSAISPDGAEVCDGTDNDCDGLTDDEDPDTPLSTWYWDEDGDGAGDDTVTTQACAPPSGYVSADSADCDDEDPTSYPGAPELCDGTDNDCDETTGEDGVITLDGEANAETIQDALDLASEGSTVTVCDGTYTEALVISETLTLQSLGGAEVTTIDADSQGAAVAIVSTVDVTISGFTVTGGSGYVYSGDTQGGGVYGGAASALTIKDCAIYGNQATYGGGIYVSAADGVQAAALALIRTTISGNSAGYFGGGLYLDEVSAALDDDSVVSENEADFWGGGVAMWGGSSLSGGSITGNVASTGGGIYAWSGENALSDGVIEGNTATGSGGGIALNGQTDGTLDITSSTITRNAAGEGGGLYLSMGAVTLDSSSEISQNDASTYGGGVYIRMESSLSGGSISGNSAPYGGGVYAVDEVNYLADVIIDGNSATYDGGGVRLSASDDASATTLTISGATITDNTAGDDGGGIDVLDSISALNATTIDGNTASDGGGGIRLYTSGVGSAAEIDVSATTVTGNTAPYGGGIFLYGSAATLDAASEVSGNTASSYGGGVLLRESSTLSGGEISNNTAAFGGGAYVYYGDNILADTVIDDNQATVYGGGVRLLTASGEADTTLDASAVTITANTAPVGGGVHVSVGDVELQSCVIESNTASSGGGGVYLYSGTLTSTASDWGTGPTDNQPDDVIVYDSSGATTTYSDFATSETFTCSTTAGSCL